MSWTGKENNEKDGNNMQAQQPMPQYNPQMQQPMPQYNPSQQQPMPNYYNPYTGTVYPPKQKAVRDNIIVKVLVLCAVIFFSVPILAGVFMPQYLKYVDKSREAADKDLLYAICCSCVLASDSIDYPIPDKDQSFILKDAEFDEGLNEWYDEVLKNLQVESYDDIEFRSKAAESTPVLITIDSKGKYSVSKGDLIVSEDYLDADN